MFGMYICLLGLYVLLTAVPPPTAVEIAFIAGRSRLDRLDRRDSRRATVKAKRQRLRRRLARSLRS